MEALAKFKHYQNPLLPSLPHYHPSFSKPISSFSLKPLSKSKIILKASSSSSSSSSSHSTNPQNNPNKFQFETLNPLSSLLKTTCIAIVTTSLVLGRFQKPSFASPVPQPTIESTQEDIEETQPDEENREEKAKDGLLDSLPNDVDGVQALIEEKIKDQDVEETQSDDDDDDDDDEESGEEIAKQGFLDSLPNDIQGLKAVMEEMIKDPKMDETIAVLDKLIEIDSSEENEWLLLKSHFHNLIGESEKAKMGFEEILAKDPLSLEAYHGLVMAISQLKNAELGGVLKKIEKAMEMCKEGNDIEEVRHFKLLVGQVKAIEGNFSEALRIYDELVEEEPRDFRPYLCQGIIYTMLRKTDEAAKQFQKYRKLVPSEHPYAHYFRDNMMTTMVLSPRAIEKLREMGCLSGDLEQ